MNKFGQNKLFSILILGVVLFIGLIYFNYAGAQSAIKATKPAPLSIDLVSFPESIQMGKIGTFIWRVDASSDLSASFTTIYWGNVSTPSALTVLDSPEAVGYPNSQIDYAKGVFKLPDTFGVNILFAKPGKVWFRAYAKIRGQHLWSEEKSLEVEK
jgi:hypothetical protein